jgi:hypothetical protein
VAGNESPAPFRFLCPVYFLLANAACLSKVQLLEFPERNDPLLSFFPTGFVSFMIAQPFGSYRLVLIGHLPGTCVPGLTDWYAILFFTLLWKIDSFAQGHWVKPFLNRPTLSRKMFVSPCTSH